MSAYVLPLVLQGPRNEAPGIEFDIVASNAVSDLLRREADIAIRHVRPDQPDLAARRLPDGAAYLYAHPHYMEQIGWIGELGELRNATFIGTAPRERALRPLRRLGLPVEVRNFRLVSNSGVVGWELVRQGHGMALMAEQVARHTGDVVRVLPDQMPIAFESWLVTHRELRTRRRIRLVFDLLADAFARPRR